MSTKAHASCCDVRASHQVYLLSLEVRVGDHCSPAILPLQLGNEVSKSMANVAS